jgi:flagellar basal body-associated protein FliL
MKVSSYRTGKQIAVCLVLCLVLPISAVSAASPLPMLGPQQSQSAPAQDQPQPSGAQTQSPQSGAAQAGSDQSPNSIAKPLGTAAAPAEPVTGVAATKPVGAAIAPAKQRRARVILIRMSIVIGAAVAVGTVVALTRASPSRPN